MKAFLDCIKAAFPWAVMGILLAIYFGFSYLKKEFTGNCIKDPDAYILEIERMNGEDQHSLELAEGDVLVVHSSVEKGILNLEIAGPKGQIIYAGRQTVENSNIYMDFFALVWYT